MANMPEHSNAHGLSEDMASAPSNATTAISDSSSVNRGIDESAKDGVRALLEALETMFNS